MSLQKIKELYEQGKYDQILVHIDQLEGEEQLAGKVYKILLLAFQQQQDKALTLANAIIAEAQKKKLPAIEIDASIAKTVVLRLKSGRARVDQLNQEEINELHQNYLKTLNKSETLLQNLDPSKNDQWDELQIKFLNEQGLYYHRIRDYPKALTIFDKCKALAEKHDFLFHLADINQVIGWVHTNLNNDSLAAEFYFLSLEQFEQLENKPESANVCSDLGNTYFNLGKYNTSLKYFLQALEIHKITNNKSMITHIQILIGWVLRDAERLEEAHNAFQKGKKFAEEINSDRYIAWALNGIGAVYISQGQLDFALTTLQQAWKYKFFQWWIGWFIGQVYWLQNQPGQAIDYLKTSLTKEQEIFSFRNETCWMIFDVIAVNLELKREKKVNEYFTVFQTLIQNTQHNVNPRMEVVFQITQAKILKESPRMSQKMEAMRIFEQIVQEKSTTIQIRYLTYALLNLCELQLLEYKSLNDETILIEIQANVSRIMDIAKKNHSYTVTAELLLLKSKLVLLTGNIPETKAMLEEAKLIAQEHQLGKLLTQIEQAEIEFIDEIQKWSELISHNTTITKLIEETKIQQYLNIALSVKEKTLSEKGFQ